ncbi:MAG: glycerol-3-phosphate dehydrogenase, partial [Rhodospirillales bacterium]|nr:glycerol-3-phosphate dehydrogenase [Rhodospirillales bacterium]
VGRPVARQVADKKPAFVVSECPLAREHIVQGAERINGETDAFGAAQHPIELIALAYGL